MSHVFSRMALVAIFLATVTIANGQRDERDFGWSLKVEPADRKRIQARTAEKSEPAIAQSDEIRVETDLVLSDLLIQDKYGTPVQGLKASDFEISESGVPQKIDVFGYGDSAIPRSIILVIDHSLSQLRHIDLSIASAKVLVDSLRPTDRMAIVSDDVELIADLTSDKDTLKAALESLRVRCTSGLFGKSHQYSALFDTERANIAQRSAQHRHLSNRR